MLLRKKYVVLMLVGLMLTGVAGAQAKKISASCWTASYLHKGIMDTSTVTVRGKVYNQSGQALAWCTLVMDDFTATTDDQGNFSFRQIPAGKYHLQVQNHCAPSKKKIVLKPGSITEMNVFVYIKKPHLPELEIPGKK